MEQQALDDTELERLDNFLAGIGEAAMSLEQVDGYFSALISGPELIGPLDAVAAIWGEDFAFESVQEATEITDLLMRHWNSIAAALQRSLSSEEVHWPLVFEDEAGLARGNEWAQGFMQGVDTRPGSWDVLFEDAEAAEILVPMLMLAHEHDPDPEMRPEPIAADQRGELIEWMAAGLADAYRYFAEARMPPVAQVRRDGAKIGRNDPCPCGSGKKYKRCCGAGEPTVH